ncbi:hypothetical protein ACHAWF_000115, partial [Thalassiosira exigua]
TDIIPSYLDLDDIKHFHGTYKEECNRHNPELDPKFKVWADRYFVISQQDETRGLGRIFFDDLNDCNLCLLFQFAKDAVNSVVPEYGPDRRSAQGRPVHGSGEGVAADAPRTVRGVQPCVRLRDGVRAQGGGRIESILTSLPETARWEYGHKPEPGSPEADIMDAFKHPRKWV